jgi:hypothetical protein
MTLPFFISQKILKLCDDIMVTFKVDTDAQAKIQGSEDLEKHPIIVKVKGTEENGALSVQVCGEDRSPLSARISGDSKNPVALGPIEVMPITIVPNLECAAKTIDLGALVGAFTKLSQGIKVEVANSGAPLSIAIGKIPVDLCISVSSPASETVFKVEIKGTVGE